ncbi:hypothetical protein [Bacteriovorax sp. Seq25_V]|uniref:hypothetical protein n=1 Tax=Bacteriovorax sp. Seq25_V TaxID=1201288 RepID=UPI00038A2068|nr:hypothetical protein [Bacteriovorax sp. Seq25_V]EQC46680.1 hypothetical protein M900_2482 [Bacteriovorax sp. Seq25_V]
MANLSDFKELKLSDIEGLKQSPCNIYLTMLSGKSIIISSEGNLVNIDLIKKYNEKDEVKILVLKTDYQKLLNARISQKVIDMKDKLSDKQWINRLQRFDNELNSVAMVRAMVSIIGLSEATLELIDGTIDSTLYTFEKIPSLKTILADICGRGDFFLQKALIINYLSVYAISKTPWNNSSTRSKLSMASFLHDFKTDKIDFILKGLPVDSSYDLRQQYEKFKTHSEDEFRSLVKVNDVPDDVAKIVRLHHVDLDGTGFPVNEVGQLNPLSQIFNISHGFALALLDQGYSKKSYSGYYYDLSGRILEKYKDSLDPFSYLL